MTDEIPKRTKEELRDEVDALRERVRRLEQHLDGDDTNHSQSSTDATDHRDAAVLSAVAERTGEPSPRQLVKLYKQHTDIIDAKTAKRRAKNLRGTDAYNEAVRE